MKKKLSSLTIAIPAYNEEESLPLVLNDILEEAPKNFTDFEVLVVNDGSTDKTGAIAARFAQKNKRIRVIHQTNQGYGGAMWRGIQEARKAYVAFLPADGQFLLKDMAACWPYLGKADLILGDRGVRLDYSRYRFLLSYGYLLLLWLFFRLPYRDVNWLNIWRTSKVKKIDLMSRGVFLLAEIIIRFKSQGLKIVQVSVPYRRRYGGRVKNASLKVALNTGKDLLKFWVLKKIKKTG